MLVWATNAVDDYTFRVYGDQSAPIHKLTNSEASLFSSAYLEVVMTGGLSYLDPVNNYTDSYSNFDINYGW